MHTRETAVGRPTALSGTAAAVGLVRTIPAFLPTPAETSHRSCTNRDVFLLLSLYLKYAKDDTISLERQAGEQQPDCCTMQSSLDAAGTDGEQVRAQRD